MSRDHQPAGEYFGFAQQWRTMHCDQKALKAGGCQRSRHVELCPLCGAYLQFGKIILTTSVGIMDHEEARRKKMGGKVSRHSILPSHASTTCSVCRSLALLQAADSMLPGSGSNTALSFAPAFMEHIKVCVVRYANACLRASVLGTHIDLFILLVLRRASQLA